MSDRYECRDGTSAKFWEVTVDDNAMTTRWGRIGSAGQEKTKQFSGAQEALVAATKAAAKKANKGYVLCVSKEAGKSAAQDVEPGEMPVRSTSGSSPKTTANEPAEFAISDSLEVDRTALPDLPAGWGYGQPAIPMLPTRDINVLRAAYLEQLRLSDLKKFRLGSSLKAKKYSSWRYTGTLQGDPATTDELWRFVMGETDGLSELAQVAFFQYGHSSYAPSEDVVRYHTACFGVQSTVRAVCRYGTYLYDYDTLSLLLRADHQDSFAQRVGTLSNRLFELRHAVALLAAEDWMAMRSWVVAEWDTIDTLVRPCVAFVLNDADLAEASLKTAQEVWYWNHSIKGAIATARPDVGVHYVTRVVGEFLDYTPAVIRQWGHAAIPLLSRFASTPRRKGGATGDALVCEAMAATPDVRMMSAAIPFVRNKNSRRFIRDQFERHPVLGGHAVTLALTSSKPEVRASARSLAALTDAKALLVPEGVPADERLLPRFLVHPPWRGSVTVKLKRQTLDLLPYATEFRLPIRRPEARIWPAVEEVIGRLAGTRSAWWKLSSVALTQLTPMQFREQVLDNENLVTSGEDAGHLVEKFGQEQTLRFILKHPLNVSVPQLAEISAPSVAPFMAEALSRKTLRSEARTWLLRYPEAAAIGLIPELLGTSKKRAAWARAALCLLFEQDGLVVLDVAKRYGAAAEKVLTSMSKLELQDIVPAKVPKLDPAFTLESLDPPRLRKNGAYLGETALRNFCEALSFSTFDDVYVGIEMVRDLCTAESLEAFAHSAFETWLAQGAEAKSNWAMFVLAWFGGDDAVRRLTPLIRRWPGEGAAKRAQLGLDVLAKIGTDTALFNVVAISQKLKYKSVKKRAEAVVQEIAAGLELTIDELGDRVVPDFGLESDGTTWIDYGPRKFQVRLDEQLRAQVFDEKGKRLKRLPKPGKKDDGELAKLEKRRFGALKKDLKLVAKQQIERLEIAMNHGRSWTAQTFRTYFVDHALVVGLIRRLVFEHVPDGLLFAIDESGQLIRETFDPVALTGEVRLSHPVTWDERQRVAWGEYLADFELLQPFEQVGRRIVRVSDLQASDPQVLGPQVSERCVSGFDIRVPAPLWVYGIEKRGWARGDIRDGGVFYSHIRLGPGGWSAELSFEGAVGIGYVEEKEPVTVHELVFARVGEVVAPADVPEVFFSEVLRDILSVV